MPTGKPPSWLLQRYAGEPGPTDDAEDAANADGKQSALSTFNSDLPCKNRRNRNGFLKQRYFIVR